MFSTGEMFSLAKWWEHIRSVPCRYCGVRIGDPCVTKNGRVMDGKDLTKGVHVDRLEQLREE